MKRERPSLFAALLVSLLVNVLLRLSLIHI